MPIKDGLRTETIHGIELGSLIVATSGQQYDIEEKPAVILYSFIIVMQVHQNKGKISR